MCNTARTRPPRPTWASPSDELVLPRAANVTSIKAVDTSYYWTWDDASRKTLNLVYGKNTQGKDVTFNGKTYPKGCVLTSARSVITALVNPTIADASLYNFYLTDSKGNSKFVIENPVQPNMSEAPITRAEATPNKGLYDMTVKLVDNITSADIDYLTNNSNVAYAIATKDVYGNEVLSEYDVQVNLTQGTTRLWQIDNDSDSETPPVSEVEINKPTALDQFLYTENVIDYYFSIDKSQTANQEATGAQLDGNMISATTPGGLTVTVNYLTTEGKVETESLNVKFVLQKTESSLGDFNWTMTSDANKQTVTVDATGLAAYLANQQPTATYAYANQADAQKYGATREGIGDIEFSSYTDDYGYTKWNASITFDPTKVAPTSYVGTIEFNGDGQTLSDRTIKFNINVSSAATFDFKPLDAYFNADKTEATAYGTPDGTNITYDLYDLFSIASADRAYVSFAEKVPAPYTENNVEYTADPWLTSGSTITVAKAGVDRTNHKFGGAYYAREITVSYQPFGNEKVETIKFAFDLTVKSEIFEGTLRYGAYDKNNQFVAGATKEVHGGLDATLTLGEILGEDVFGKKYNIRTDPRINKHEVILADDNAKEYLLLDGNKTATAFDPTDDKITISKKSASTAIVTPPTCTVRVVITDEWGKQKTVDVQVKVTK